MRSKLAASVAVAVALMSSAWARAATEITDSETVSAKVESIDLASRTVELKTAEGETASIVVPEGIANLEKLKVGDTVKATYVVSLATKLMKPGDEPAPAAVSAAKQGDGQIVGARQVSAVLKVNAVDVATNSVTLTGPKGNTRTVKVKRPDLQEKLKSLKPGDEVQITYTEAMAIKVEPQTK